MSKKSQTFLNSARMWLEADIALVQHAIVTGCSSGPVYETINKNGVESIGNQMSISKRHLPGEFHYTYVPFVLKAYYIM